MYVVCSDMKGNIIHEEKFNVCNVFLTCNVFNQAEQHHI